MKEGKAAPRPRQVPREPPAGRLPPRLTQVTSGLCRKSSRSSDTVTSMSPGGRGSGAGSLGRQRRRAHGPAAGQRPPTAAASRASSPPGPAERGEGERGREMAAGLGGRQRPPAGAGRGGSCGAAPGARAARPRPGPAATCGGARPRPGHYSPAAVTGGARRQWETPSGRRGPMGGGRGREEARRRVPPPGPEVAAWGVRGRLGARSAPAGKKGKSRRKWGCARAHGRCL